MSLRQIDLTTALRPTLLPDEVLLFVQDAVGLYQGKYKIPDYQNGQAYLTSHRVCYIDNDEPRQRAVAVDLKDIDRSEFYAGFLKASPKVILYPKPSKRTSSGLRTQLAPVQDYGASSPSPSPSPAPSTPRLNVNATWICPICSFSNPVPHHFDPTTANDNTPLPTCQTCGMKPPLVTLIKAALASMQSNNKAHYAVPGDTGFANSPTLASSEGFNGGDMDLNTQTGLNKTCPRCTFENDSSLLACEMCGAALSGNISRTSTQMPSLLDRSESPGPVLSSNALSGTITDSIKFSFRAGGEKVFSERLRGALVQRKWLLHSAPPVPKVTSGPMSSASGVIPAGNRPSFGIAGLEQRGMSLRKNNEMVIGNAFEDLEALMSSAKEIIELAEQFAAQTQSGETDQSGETSAILSQSASALNLFTTKDMLHSGSGSESLYLSELSRNLAEFLTDDATGVLRKEGGIISLVDLWAVFNRARGGVELVSPTDFLAAAEMWDKLRLPIRLRKFKSGLLVVQARDRTDEKTVASLLHWLQELQQAGTPNEVPWDWNMFGRGVTAAETADRFGWSVGVAVEELEMAEERGALCRDVAMEGVTFWVNHLTTPEAMNNLEAGMAGLIV